VFAYGSQNGTSQEIARNLHAEAVQHGFSAEVSSLNELGFSNISAARTPFLVLVTSSTGDGDPPDNAAQAWVQIKKKHPEGLLKGVRFTSLGLGDSNYTRFMHVPRTFKSRLEELGAEPFYRSAEADEVEGIEAVVDPWSEGLWEPLKKVVAEAAPAAPPAAADTTAAPAAVVSAPAAASTAAAPPVAEEASKGASEVPGAAAAAAAAAPPAAQEAPAAPVATGGAAILAQLMARAKTPPSASSAAPGEAVQPKVVFAYGSQNGTSQEIARNLHAEAVQHGFSAEVSSLNELGFSNISAARTPFLVLVTSSTGDGDPPDNAAQAWVQIKKKHPEGLLKGVRFTSLGLGDSNYTRFMHVPRTFKSRLEELGAEPFYRSAEADEVEGIEAVVDPWSEGLWEPLKKAVDAAAAPGADKPSAAEPNKEAEAATTGAAAATVVTAAVANGSAPKENGVAVDAAAAAASPTPALSAVPSAASDGKSSTPSDSVKGHKPMLKGLNSSRQSSNEAAGAAAAAADARASPRSGNTTAGRSSMDAGSTTPRGTARRNSLDTPRRGSVDKPSSRMGVKPISVHFPKREETVVRRKDEQLYGLNLGLAPVGVDTKGAPAPLPCRVKVVWDKDPDAVNMAKTYESARPTKDDLAYRDPEGLYSASKPFWAEMSDARYETAFWSDRKVLHVQLELADSGMVYEAGDAVGVLPTNPPELVGNLLKRLNLQPDAVFRVRALDAGTKSILSHIPCPCTIGYALSHCVDLTSATKKSVLRMLAEHTHDPSEKRTLIYLTSKAGKEAYQHEIMEHQPSILDLLARFDTCSPPIDALLDALPPLAPRLYSITTSFVENPDRVQVALSVVRFRTRYGSRLGVASTWLDRLAQPLSGGDSAPPQGTSIKLPIYLRRNKDFKPPQDLSKPLIMVGPGTGVAPFRGFLQHRRHHIRKQYPGGVSKDQVPEGLGQAWLYFGCRRDDEDYIYKDDLQSYAADATLTQLKVAFSRAQEEKVYVQNLMRTDAAQLYKLIEAGAYVFVCGDGAGMAKDVHAALLDLLKEHGGMSEAEATEKLAAMVKEERYVRDVWS